MISKYYINQKKSRTEKWSYNMKYIYKSPYIWISSLLKSLQLSKNIYIYLLIFMFKINQFWQNGSEKLFHFIVFSLPTKYVFVQLHLIQNQVDMKPLAFAFSNFCQIVQFEKCSRGKTRRGINFLRITP